MHLKIIFLGSPGQFEEGGKTYRERYMPEVYGRIKSQKGIIADKLEVRPFPLIGRALSIGIKAAIEDFRRYDIVHNFSQDPVFPLNRGRSILVTTVHFSPIQLEYARSKNLKYSAWIQLIIRLSYISAMRSDHIIANSTQTKDDLVKSLGIPASRITAIDLGVDERYFKRAQVPRRGKFKVGYLGMLNEYKNVPFAIRAFRSLADDDMVFEIWGRADSEGYGRHLHDAAGPDRRILFRGYAPGEMLVEIYDSFDVFVFPTFSESFGLPILEAQTRGVPVIIYKNAKIPKEVRRYCFEAEDEAHMAQMIKELKDRGYADGLRRKAMTYARHFTWDKTAGETLDVYNKLIKDG